MNSPIGRLSPIVQAADRLSSYFSRIAGWACLLLVLITVEQVVARYLFNSSSVALQELEWHLFGILFLFSMAHALAEDQHVRVDVLYSKYPPKLKATLNLLGNLLFVLPVSCIILYYGLDYALAARDFISDRPPDYFCAAWFDPSGWAYQILAPVEANLRSWLLVGERSADPGGLEGRWLIKAAIPFGALLLALQSCALIIRNFAQIFMNRAHTRQQDPADGT